ncbi:MAG TPA: ABC-2 family transporter protein [Myxococcota bacterium]|jgi:ABC-2 type transport system permease protein|nr:ABC-2 family transporter protein [Myxococcota bacterium]
MSRLRQIWRALGAGTRVAVMIALQYRASFVGEAAMALLWIFWMVVPLFVVFRYTASGIDGWTYDEALLVVGCFITLQGILEAFIDPNLRAVVEHVRQGTLDFVLLKPIDAQILVSVQRTAPTKIPHMLAGVGLLVVASARLAHPPGPAQVLLAVLLLLAGAAILHSLWTLVVSTSFWFVRVDNLSYLLGSVLDAGRWPVGFFQGAVRFVLTFILPVGLMTTWPALALRGLISPAAALGALGLAAAFALVARAVWTFALRHYSSASS